MSACHPSSHPPCCTAAQGPNPTLDKDKARATLSNNAQLPESDVRGRTTLSVWLLRGQISWDQPQRTQLSPQSPDLSPQAGTRPEGQLPGKLCMVNGLGRLGSQGSCFETPF